MGSVDWALKKCKGQICDDPEFPILDYDGDNCICRVHPCWDDNGKTHSCGPETPYLTFGYTATGALICSCRKFPFFGSVYIYKELCPGEGCETEDAPIMDYDEKTQTCVCISHPCLHDNGMTHSCNDPD